MAFPTVFNTLGPLLNPLPLDAIVIGVSDASLIDPFIDTLKLLGIKRALVVHGVNGLDEVCSLSLSIVSPLISIVDLAVWED